MIDWSAPMGTTRGKARKPSGSSPSAAFARATVRADDLYSQRIAGRADLLVARAVGWAEICAHYNAASCAACVLGLYRAARRAPKTAARSAERIDAKTIAGRARLAWLSLHAAGRRHAKTAQDAAESGDVLRVTDHPALAFMRDPNPWLTGREWAYLRFKAQEIAGNSYTYLWPGEGGASPEAYTLTPEHVTILHDRGSMVTGYRYSRNRVDYLTVEPGSVMHQRFKPSLWSPIIGEPPLASVIQQLDLFAAATAAETAKWLNGGRPDMLIECPAGANASQIDEIRTRLQSEHRGPSKAGGLLVVSNGVKVSPMGLPTKDMEYRGGLEDIRKMVYAAFDIPQSVMEINQANLASSSVGATQHARSAVAPRIAADAESVTQWVLPLFGLDPEEWWFAYDNPIPEDQARGVELAAKLASSPTPIASVNELRALAGLPPTGNEDDNTIQPRPALGPPVPFKAAVRCSGWHFGHVHHEKALAPGPNADELDKAAAALEKKLAAWHAKVADALKADPRASPADFARELDAILERGLSSLMKAGAAAAADAIGDDAAALKPSVDFARSYVVRLRDELTASFASDINAAVREAVAAGGSVDDATDEVAGIIGEQASYRAERIARTEVARAFNMGQVDVYRQAGVRKDFVLAGDACEVCNAIREEFPDPVDAGDAYVSIGDSFGGVTNDYSTSYAPPFHPNCRCAIVPVLEDA